MGMRGQTLLLACGVALFFPVNTSAQETTSGRRHSFHAVARVTSGTRQPGADIYDSKSDCGTHRSPLQRAIDKAYHTQRRRMDRAISKLNEQFVSSWSTKQAWHIWELYPPIYNCPTKEKLGNQPEDGGKFICGIDTYLQDPGCTVLSFGSQGETSFERDVLSRTPCTVHTFDPTLNQMQRAKVAEVPEIMFHDYGLGMVDRKEQIANFSMELKTLPSVLYELDIQWVDLLKIDIEGSEWDVLEQLLAHYGTNLPFTQLQIEFHLQVQDSSRRILDIMRKLEAAGLRAFSSEYNFLAGDHVPGYLEYSFLNVKDCRVLV